MILVADGSPVALAAVVDENEVDDDVEEVEVVEEDVGFTLHRLDPMIILAMMAS